MSMKLGARQKETKHERCVNINIFASTVQHNASVRAVAPVVSATFLSFKKDTDTIVGFFRGVYFAKFWGTDKCP